MDSLVRYNAAQTFKYQPITEPDGIRLLILHPAEDETAEIRCSLIHTTLSTCEYEVIDHYTALSYVWGDASIRKPIWIEGSRVEITTNLHQALTHMRDATRPLRIWADALCINQNDDDEKNRQVSVMARIYALANHTIIDVGTDIDSNNQVDHPKASPSANVAKTIALQPWFERVWVFQELVFSKEPWVQYGRRRWTWDRFYTALTNAMENDGSLNSKEGISALAMNHGLDEGQGERTKMFLLSHLKICFERIADMQKTRQGHGDDKGSNMMDLVLARRGLGVTDPRDMIFAHSSFASDKALFRVDYSKTTIEQVYADFAVHHLQKGDIRILFHVDESNANQAQIPTWAPNWMLKKISSQSPFLSKELPVLDGGFSNLEVDVSYVTSKMYHVGIYSSILPTLLMIRCRPEIVVKFSDPLTYSKFSMVDITRFSHICSGIRSFTDSYQIEVFLEMYNAWRSIIQDDEILPPAENIPTRGNLSQFDEWIGVYGRRPRVIFSARATTTTRSAVFSRRPNLFAPVQDKISECLIAGFGPFFDRSFLEGRRLARFSSGVLALVPASVRLGDFAVLSDTVPVVGNYGSKKGVGRWREPILLRPCPRPKDHISDSILRSKITAATIGKGLHWSHPDLLGYPVEHCTLVGPTFMHAEWSISQSVSHQLRIYFN